MLQITIPLALATAYLGAGVRCLHSHQSSDKLGWSLAILALIAHGAWLGIDLSSGASRVSIAQTLSMVALTFAIIALLSATHSNGRILAGLLLIMAGGTIGFAVFGSPQPSSSHTSGWPLIAHIVFSIISYALLAVAAMIAIVMAWKERQVRVGNLSSLATRLPPLQALDSELFVAILAGFATLSLSMFSGLIFIEDIHGQHLTHKTILTALAWLVYGLLLLGRWRFGWRGVIAVRWTLLGFGILLLAYFGSRLILEVLLNRSWG